MVERAHEAHAGRTNDGADAGRRRPAREPAASYEHPQVAAVRALQRHAGNRATARLLRASGPPVAPASSEPLARDAAFARDARRLLADATAGDSPLVARTGSGRAPARAYPPLAVQREVSTAQFIKDTTSYFIFESWSWRKGTDVQRTRIEGLLARFEAAKDVVEKVLTLQALTLAARGIVSDSTKFQDAVGKIVREGDALVDELQKSEEWIAHQESERRAKEEAAEEAQKQELATLAQLDWDGRVAAFRKKYGAGALFETLIAGTEELQGKAQLLTLTQNFANIGFVYSMKSVSPKQLLAGRTDGDCSTVAGAMAAIVQELFLADATVAHCNDLLVDSTESTIDGAKPPSGEGGAFWIFDNHYWVESGAGNFDPLFAREKSEAGWHLLAGKTDDADLKTEIEDFGGGWIILALITDSGLLNTRASSVTREQWAEHVKHTKATASYEQMRARTGVG